MTVYLTREGHVVSAQAPCAVSQSTVLALSGLTSSKTPTQGQPKCTSRIRTELWHRRPSSMVSGPPSMTGNTYCSAWAAMYPKKPNAHHAELNMRKKQETSPQNLGMIGGQIKDKQHENTCEVSLDLVIRQTFVSSPSTLQCEETSAVWWTKSVWSILNQAKFVNRARTAEECLNLAEIL